jgi:hypothetical protein
MTTAAFIKPTVTSWTVATNTKNAAEVAEPLPEIFDRIAARHESKDASLLAAMEPGLQSFTDHVQVKPSAALDDYTPGSGMRTYTPRASAPRTIVKLDKKPPPVIKQKATSTKAQTSRRKLKPV